MIQQLYECQDRYFMYWWAFVGAHAQPTVGWALGPVFGPKVGLCGRLTKMAPEQMYCVNSKETDSWRTSRFPRMDYLSLIGAG
jgi:hypothetical protein